MEKYRLVLYRAGIVIFAQIDPQSRSPTMFEDLGKYLLIAFVAFFGVLAWRAWQIRQASPAWPSVQGEMISTRVFARNQTGGEQGVSTHEWLTEVHYRYTVQGQTYEGNRLKAFGRHHFSREQAEAELAPFPAGQAVRVYYNPDKPAESVLIPG